MESSKKVMRDLLIVLNQSTRNVSLTNEMTYNKKKKRIVQYYKIVAYNDVKRKIDGKFVHKRENLYISDSMGRIAAIKKLSELMTDGN
jgi:fibrillarin-like rRNA methylase